MFNLFNRASKPTAPQKPAPQTAYQGISVRLIGATTEESLPTVNNLLRERNALSISDQKFVDLMQLLSTSDTKQIGTALSVQTPHDLYRYRGWEMDNMDGKKVTVILVEKLGKDNIYQMTEVLMSEGARFAILAESECCVDSPFYLIAYRAKKGTDYVYSWKIVQSEGALTQGVAAYFLSSVTMHYTDSHEKLDRLRMIVGALCSGQVAGIKLTLK